jgi:prepilin-type processing-associated H-X9-DG protein
MLPGNPFSGPPPIGLNPWPTWIYTLSNQISGVDGLRICPSDALRQMLATNFGCSYVLNDYTATDEVAGSPSLTAPTSSVTGPGGDKYPTFPATRRIDALPNWSGTILVFEASQLSQRIGDLQTHPDAWFFGWDRVLADIDPYRHGRCANYLYADAHVELIPAQTLQRRIEAGDNFAVPPH